MRPDTEPPVFTQAEVPAGWLALAAGARLVAKDPRTTRETVFRGPARARACVGGGEESWLASGSFESVVGAGETPGAEEWVVTPHAVIRYAASRLRVDVRAKDTRVTMGGGVAFLWATGPAAVAGAKGSDGGAQDTGTIMSEGWRRLTEGSTSAAGAGPVEASVDLCSSLARRSHELASALLSGPPGPTSNLLDGGTAAEQVVTRRLARAACALASLRLGAEGAEGHGADGALQARVTEADSAWRAVPLAGSGP